MSVPGFTVIVTGPPGPAMAVLQVRVVAVVALSERPDPCRRPVQSVDASTARKIPDRWNRADVLSIIILSLLLNGKAPRARTEGSLYNVSDKHPLR
jgi:hypothetical protein